MNKEPQKCKKRLSRSINLTKFFVENLKFQPRDHIKQKFYYGVKLHILAICQDQKLPIPCYIAISEGSMFDI